MNSQLGDKEIFIVFVLFKLVLISACSEIFFVAVAWVFFLKNNSEECKEQIKRDLLQKPTAFAFPRRMCKNTFFFRH